METISALLAIWMGNSPVPEEFPAQRPVTRSSDVFFDLRLNKRLSKQSRGWWFETLSCPLWRQCNGKQLPYQVRNLYTARQLSWPDWAVEYESGAKHFFQWFNYTLINRLLNKFQGRLSTRLLTPDAADEGHFGHMLKKASLIREILWKIKEYHQWKKHNMLRYLHTYCKMSKYLWESYIEDIYDSIRSTGPTSIFMAVLNKPLYSSARINPNQRCIEAPSRTLRSGHYSH